MTNKLTTSYEHEKSGLLRYIRSKISNLRDAEDILQEVFLQAIKHANVMEPVDNLMGWLYTAAHNRVIDWYRHRQTAERFENDLTDEIFGEADPDSLDDEEQAVLLERLYAAIGELPEEQRRVILLQSLHEMTFREIAKMEGISINTLLARKRYAVAYLRNRLADLQFRDSNS